VARSRNWLIDEARVDLDRLLDAARLETQYIIAPQGRFKISYGYDVTTSLEEILDAEGPLTPDDIKNI
jgi:hypothetical protein